uniref:sulfotransferase family protein n=1 Tax=uncultured Sphingomonas sp. TaxID=158754 RepID=UPI0035CC5153
MIDPSFAGAMKTGLPTFVVIGAVKGATTWIHDQLQDNPTIFLPGPEPHFFSKEYDQGLDFYRDMFARAKPGQIVGEKSADYFAHPLAAERLARTLPDARLVLQLRNPIDRAYSDYKMLFRRGTVTDGPEAYLDGRESDQPRFLLDGLYARHLARWLQHFDARQIEILLFEDVLSRPSDTVASVCRHIGAPYHFSTQVGTRPRNNSAEHFLPLAMRSAFSPMKRAVRPLRGSVAFEGIRRMFAREIAYPPLTPDLRQRLIDYYRADIGHLSAILGRRLDHWVTAERRVA